MIVIALVALVIGAIGGYSAGSGFKGLKAVANGVDACERTNKTIVVNLEKYPAVVAHVRWQVNNPGRDGEKEPRILTWDPRDDAEVDRRRRQSTRVLKPWNELPTAEKKKWARHYGYPNDWDEEWDRDEYAVASSEEGGREAEARYVLRSQNRGAGASMESQLDEYCPGTQFRIRLRYS